MRSIAYLAALAVGLRAGVCLADDASAAPPRRIETIRVTAVASRVVQSVDDTPATVSVIEREDLDRGLARDMRDALRYEPGVSIENAPARFGLGNISIRGLDGNRVQMLMDGVRLPDGYRVGSFSNASRNPFDLGLLSRIEILRGPGSALYGSDALAGVLSMTTLDPKDLLRPGAAAGGFAQAGYEDADRGVSRSGSLAGRIHGIELLVGASRSDAHEVENRGDVNSSGATRTVANPQDGHSASQLAKIVMPLAGGGRLRATYDHFESAVATDVLSLNPQSIRTVSLAGDDRAERTRASVDGVFHALGPVDRLSVIAYRQRSSTAQDTNEVRANTTAQCLSAAGTVSCRREARFRFEQEETGLTAIGQSGAGTTHALVYGAEWSRTKAEEMRDGQQTNLNTGAVSNVVGTDIFPTRDFPKSHVDRAGAFAQDEIAVAGATLIPALRFDRFRMSPESDAIYQAGNPGRTPVGITDSAWSPKLGVLFPVARDTTLTLQAAAGFRAPPYFDVNVGLSNLPLGYTVIPNPELRPETSRGFEAGLRGRHAIFDYTLTVYRTDYRNLIISRAPLVCPGDPHCVTTAPITFQSQNVTRARIDGVEARVEARIATGWTAKAGASASRGDDRTRDVPLNSVDPPKIAAGLAWESAAHAMGAELHVTHAWAKSRIDASAGAIFAAPSYAVADLTGFVKIGAHATLYAGLFNAFDRKYWLWSDVRGVLNPGASVDRYTQPGRNAGVQLKVQF
jgi:hemoglobin/transferrin/lactoferrin receptor protein